MPISDLTYNQTAALGYAAGLPWGHPPKRPVTWRSLIGRGLIDDLRSMALTEKGKAVVAELDALNTRPKPIETHEFEPAYRATTAGRIPVDGCGLVTFKDDVGSFCGLPADHPVHGVTAPNPQRHAAGDSGCPSCGACGDHGGCAYAGGDAPAEGDCASCGACAACISECASQRAGDIGS